MTKQMTGTISMVAVAMGLALAAAGSSGPVSADDGNTVVIVDPSDDAGRSSTVALDADGNPVIAYVDDTTGELKLLHCDDPVCAGGDTASVLDVVVRRFPYTDLSLAIAPSGNPVIAYADWETAELRLARCNDPRCVGGDESIEIISAPEGTVSGRYVTLVEMALDRSGRPVLLQQYSGTSDPALSGSYLVSCNDTRCAGNDERVEQFFHRRFSTAAVDFDDAGNPVIAFFHAPNATQHLSVMQCNDRYCAGGDDLAHRVDEDFSYDGFNAQPGLAIGADGNPVVAYSIPFDSRDRGLLRVAKCGNASCSQSSTATVASLPYHPYDTIASLAIGVDGNPVVALGSSSGPAIVRCDDPACVGGVESTVRPDTSGWPGNRPSLALDDNGNPVIAYSSLSGQARMTLLRCGDPTCLGANSDAPVILPLRSQSDTAGFSISVQPTIYNPDDDAVTFAATGLPDGISINASTGVMSGVPIRSGLVSVEHTVTVTVTASDRSTSTNFIWRIEPGFVCEAVGGTLEWTDINARNFNVRLALDGVDRWIATTTDSSIEAPSQYGVYEIIARESSYGRNSYTTCTAAGGPTTPTDFRCTVADGTATWTDLGDVTYRVRYDDGTTDRYRGKTSNTAFPARNRYGVYTVITNVDGERVSTDCEAPDGPAVPAFDCEITGDSLTWSDQGVARYFIRRVDGDTSTYVGSVTGESTYTVADPAAEHAVVAYVEGVRTETRCQRD